MSKISSVSVKKIVRKTLALPPIVLGVVVLVIAVRGREGPKRVEETERARTVRVMEMAPMDVVPRVFGYGTARPGKVWKAVAEVGGKIVEMNPLLRKGAFIKKDTVLLQIDPTEYNLEIARLEASIQSTQAELEELDLKEKNERAALEIEKRALDLKMRDLKREEELLKSKTVSRSQYDAVERDYLVQKAKVQAGENILRLIPAQRRILQAKLAQTKAQLDEAKLDLAHTTVKAPFDCRVSELNVEEAQYVQPGQVMVEGDGTDITEVDAQFFRPPFGVKRRVAEESAKGRRLAPRQMAEAMGLTTIVRLVELSIQAEWPGRLARISDTLDPETRTMGVIVEVEKPYENVIPGVRPPLVKGMYCEVEMRSPRLEGQMVVPRSALRNHHVFVVGKESRLERRDVSIAFEQSNFAVIKEGLSTGDRVVVSDLIPAMDGMLLIPVVDEELPKRLSREALAQEGRQ